MKGQTLAAMTLWMAVLAATAAFMTLGSIGLEAIAG